MSGYVEGPPRDTREDPARMLTWLVCNGDSAVSTSVVASEELVLDEAHRGQFCAATVLRAFDRLRRQLSLRLTGHEGLFAGYDWFELLHPDPPAGTVCLVAQVTESNSAARHRVRYSAYGHLETGGRFGRIDLLVAHGVGTTVVPSGHRGRPGARSARLGGVPTQLDRVNQSAVGVWILSDA